MKILNFYIISFHVSYVVRPLPCNTGTRISMCGKSEKYIKGSSGRGITLNKY